MLMGKIVQGKGDFLTLYPDLKSKIDFDKTDMNKLYTYGKGSHENDIYWFCETHKHDTIMKSYNMSISHYLRGQRCPYCSTPPKRILPGFNDMKTLRPDMAEEWDYERNGIDCSLIFPNSNEPKYWWKCKYGHHYESTCNNRYSAAIGCDVCAGRRVLSGFNDLVTWCKMHNRQDILDSWDYELNDVTPQEVFGQEKTHIYKWKCDKGHHYERTCNARSRLYSCPVCNCHELQSGVNDFATLYPELLSEWDYEKNSISPYDILPGANKTVHWKCAMGHTWSTKLHQRTRLFTGCKKCDRQNHTSFAEQSIYYYLKQFFSDTENGNVDAIGMELDIYIPSKSVAIEYDGQAYHSPNRKTDVKKNQICKESGILLIRIQETNDYLYDDCICITRNKNRSKSELTSVIKQVFTLLGNDNADIDVVRDESEILSLYMSIKERNGLSALYPDLAKEWHPTKNGLLTPDKVISGSMQSVWWLGKCGHEWQSRVAHRSNGVGCPYCNNSGTHVLPGVNDLQTVCPDIAKEWNYKRNQDLKNGFGEDISTPDKVKCGSSQKVWWKGTCGHEWDMPISDRTGKKHAGCPYCSNHRLLVGFNDLASMYPEVAKEWHPTKNGEKTPDKVLYGSGTKVWWLGECGHNWQDRIIDRTTGNMGCPYCRPSNRRGTLGVRVMCIETGVIYNNLGEAAKDKHTHKASIVNCCKGRQNQAGGYHWKYI